MIDAFCVARSLRTTQIYACVCNLHYEIIAFQQGSDRICTPNHSTRSEPSEKTFRIASSGGDRLAVVRLYLRLAATRVKLRFSTSTKMSTQQTAFRTRRAVGALMIVFASFALLNGERHVRKVLKNKMENFQQTPFSLKTRLQLVAAAGRASSPPPTRRLQPPSMARRPHHAKLTTRAKRPPTRTALFRAAAICTRFKTCQFQSLLVYF